MWRVPLPRRAPALFVTLLCLASFTLQARFFLLAPVAYLATNIQDDSYYYLKPAWSFPALGQFSFDGGLSVTYGFQPLWMLVVTALSFFTRDKELLLRSVLVLGVAIYCATGILLYFLSKKWHVGWTAAVLPSLWVANPWSSLVYASGKENAINAFLLLAVLLVAYRVQGQKSSAPLNPILLGGLCGLLVLSRVNNVAFVLLLVSGLALASQWSWKVRAGRAALVVVGLAIVAAPWLAYSLASLGSLFPNSGSLKLASGRAALIYYLGTRLPAVRLEWLANLLTPAERNLLTAAGELTLPSISLTLKYLFVDTPMMVAGFSRTLLAISLPRWLQDASLWICGGAFLGAATAGLYQLGPRLRSLIRLSTLRLHTPVAVLFVFALGNSVTNSLLMPAYVEYATWYAVAEVFVWMILASWIVPPGVTMVWQRGKVGHIAALVCVLLFLSPWAYRYARLALPGLSRPATGYQAEAWEAQKWMNEHLPKGARVGSWNSGLLGYFSEAATVVNLDGLANSPAFVQDVVLRETRPTEGGSGDGSASALWAYIRAQGIQYLADGAAVDNLGRRPVFGFVPPDHYEVVYRGGRPLRPDTPNAQFVILRLYY